MGLSPSTPTKEGLPIVAEVPMREIAAITDKVGSFQFSCVDFRGFVRGASEEYYVDRISIEGGRFGVRVNLNMVGMKDDKIARAPNDVTHYQVVFECAYGDIACDPQIYDILNISNKSRASLTSLAIELLGDPTPFIEAQLCDPAEVEQNPLPGQSAMGSYSMIPLLRKRPELNPDGIFGK